MDGTVIRIARPTHIGMQRAVYNGHKRCHALKFQIVSLPDGLTIHVGGTHTGLRRDITVWRRSELDEQLQNILSFDGKQF